MRVFIFPLLGTRVAGVDSVENARRLDDSLLPALEEE